MGPSQPRRRIATTDRGAAHPTPEDLPGSAAGTSVTQLREPYGLGSEVAASSCGAHRRGLADRPGTHEAESSRPTTAAWRVKAHQRSRPGPRPARPAGPSCANSPMRQRLSRAQATIHPRQPKLARRSSRSCSRARCRPFLGRLDVARVSSTARNRRSAPPGSRRPSLTDRAAYAATAGIRAAPQPAGSSIRAAASSRSATAATATSSQCAPSSAVPSEGSSVKPSIEDQKSWRAIRSRP